jgi:hypothetical protein
MFLNINLNIRKLGRFLLAAGLAAAGLARDRGFVTSLQECCGARD